MIGTIGLIFIKSVCERSTVLCTLLSGKTQFCTTPKRHLVAKNEIRIFIQTYTKRSTRGQAIHSFQSRDWLEDLEGKTSIEPQDKPVNFLCFTAEHF